MSQQIPITSTPDIFSQTTESKIFALFSGLPYLAFSPTGKKNLMNRFKLTESELNEKIIEFEAREGLTIG